MLELLVQLVPEGRSVPWAMAALAAAVVTIGIAKSGFGGGIGILAVPLMAAAVDPAAALGVMLPILIVADALAAVQHRKNFSKPHLLSSLQGAVVGIVLGSLVLWLFTIGQAQTRALNLTVGAVCVGFVGVQVYRLLGGRVTAVPDTAASARGAGGLAGLVSTVAHAAGPVMTIFLLEQRLDKRALVGTLVLFFFAVNLLKLPTYFLQGIINGQTLRASAVLVLLVPVGSWLGGRLYKVVAERPFTLVMYLGAAAAGGRMLWQGLT
jgi:uncharacterized membrane protein YfcA